jgi:hypothetical protein
MRYPASLKPEAKFCTGGREISPTLLQHNLAGQNPTGLRLSPLSDSRTYRSDLYAYGPGQAAEKFIPYTIRTLLKGKPPEVTNGERLID